MRGNKIEDFYYINRHILLTTENVDAILIDVAWGNCAQKQVKS